MRARYLDRPELEDDSESFYIFLIFGSLSCEASPRSFGIVSVLPCPPQQQVPSVSDFKSEERKVSAARPIRLGHNGHKVLKATD